MQLILQANNSKIQFNYFLGLQEKKIVTEKPQKTHFSELTLS